MSVSLLWSQLGYYLDGEKQVFIRLKEDDAPLALPLAFTLEDEKGQIVHTGQAEEWGCLWGSRWYVLDFTGFASEGAFVLRCAGEATAPFLLGRHVLSTQGYRTITLEQLRNREEPGVGGWRDCGSQIRELSSMVVTVHGLADALENDKVLRFERDELIRQLIRGGDAIRASQELWPDNPEKNGRFNHDAFRMTHYGTTDYHNWHDTAYGITGLVRAAKALKTIDPLRAEDYMACAVRAYENAVLRPYNLEEDIVRRDHPEIDYSKDQFRELMDRTGRVIYNKGDDWALPTALRTKDKMCFAWACALLHEATGEARYLDSAIEYADAVCERQCLDLSRADDGLGFFHEFENDDQAFVLEFAHNHKFFMGNIEPTNLAALMYLVRVLPSGERTACYLRTLRLYADAYVKHSASLTPLSIYPLTVHSGEHRGVHFFSTTVHGFTCLYGQIAKNLLELAAFLGDESLARLAERNLAFPIGRNPGFGDAYVPSRWDCMSLIKGVGCRSFGGVHSLSVVPDGSAMNGFASHQFEALRPLSDLKDEPLGIWKEEGVKYFNEDYLPHSHGYVSGVAKREMPCTIRLQVTDGDRPFSGKAKILWSDGEEESFTLGADGRARLTTERMYRRGILHIPGLAVEKTIVTLPGGCETVCINLAHQVTVSLSGKETLTLTVANHGKDSVSGEICLTASGIDLTETAFPYDLRPGASVALPVKTANAAPVWLIAQSQSGADKVLLTSFANE